MWLPEGSSKYGMLKVVKAAKGIQKESNGFVLEFFELLE
jgi:hypothetical protein